jgi:hypothetical protein
MEKGSFTSSLAGEVGDETVVPFVVLPVSDRVEEAESG